ncbi:MAG: alpha/beta hydrolase [Mycobacteriales bacterium]
MTTSQVPNAPANTDPSKVLTTPDGRRLAWTECGDPHGRPLLWFHGSPSSRLDAAPGGPYSAELADLGVRLIGADRPGYGLSATHPGRTMLTVAEDTATLADTLDLDRVALAGWSGGGPFALAVAARLGNRVSGVAVLAGVAPTELAGPDDLAEADLFALVRADPAALAERFRQLADVMRNDPFSAALSLVGDFLSEADLAAVSDPAYAAAMAASLSEAARSNLAGYQQDLDALTADWPFPLTDVTQPVILLHGRQDRIVPMRHGQALANALPNAALTITDDGHLSIVGQLPALANTLLGAR